MKKTKSASFFEGALVLVIANALVKVIGAFFAIPITNILGGDGYGIFTVAYYVYTAVFVISTAGLPVAVSRMVAEANALGKYTEVRRIFKVALALFMIIGAIGTAVMVIFAQPLVDRIGNSRAYYPVLAIAPSIFFVTIVSAIRGYFQGLSNMVPTAISQVIEAAGKLVFGLLLSWWLIDRGYSLEIVVSGAIAGVTIGTVLSALYTIFVKLRAGSGLPEGAVDVGVSASSGEIAKKLIKIAVPITISSSVLSITNLIDTAVVLNRLQDVGHSEEAANFIYGCYGIAVKMFNLPQALIVALAVSIIPAVAAAYARKDNAKAATTITAALRFTGIMALPCAAGLAVLSKPILSLLYYNVPDEVEMAAPLLVIISPAVLLIALVSVTNAILQAMGREKVPMISFIIGGTVKLLTNHTLVGTPGIEIYGAPIGTILCYGSISLINLVIIMKHIKGISIIESFFKPFVSAAVMGAFAYIAYNPIQAILGAKLGVVAAIGLSACVYLIMLVAIRALPKEDVLMLPKGQKIAKLLRL
ncbi:MAG: polysaccharide biosynthesis protein [Clostridia bacterium]|nr:polysaccharide biosynthesis protein [Clostridia bacterium]